MDFSDIFKEHAETERQKEAARHEARNTAQAEAEERKLKIISARLEEHIQAVVSPLLFTAKRQLTEAKLRVEVQAVSADALQTIVDQMRTCTGRNGEEILTGHEVNAQPEAV